MSTLRQLLGVLPVDSFLWLAPLGTVSCRELPYSISYSVLGNPRARTTQRGYIKVGSPQVNTGQLQRNIPSLELPRLTLYSSFTLPTAHSCLLPFPSRDVNESLACSTLSKSASSGDLLMTIPLHF